MEQLNQMGEMTDAMLTIRAQSDKLVAALGELGAWTFDITAEVSTRTYDMTLTVKKPNGKGFIDTVSKEDILYYENDTDTLVNQITEEIIEKLYRAQIRGVIEGTISRGVKNIAKMVRVS